MNYRELEAFLSKRIEHAKTQIIGTSVLKRFIYSVNFDFSSKMTVIIQGAMHAREHITTDLIIKLICDVSQNYNKYRALNMPNIIFVPMVNPDGVQLCYENLKSIKSAARRRFLKSINSSSNFALFKANANGVDLNNNFDAKWGCGAENGLVPAAHGYIGSAPMSEPEVQALALLTLKVKPFFTISYHAKGQEVYYQFYNKKENLHRDKKIAKIIARTLRYKIVNYEKVSSGGYKDWCVMRLGIPAVTIEVGKDSLKHPILKDSLNQIYRRNKNILKALIQVQKEFINDKRRKIHEFSTKTSQNCEK